MKIRTDFVTNSSSSNFTVEVAVYAKPRNIYIEEDPFIRNPNDGGEASFKGDLRKINEHLSSVEALAKWLGKSLVQNTHTGRTTPGFRDKRNRFIEDITRRIKSVRDIESIVVTRQYSAWGEFSDLVDHNDGTLKELAQKYMDSKGIEKERAKAELITHIQTTTEARGYSFGSDSVVSRYNWHGKSVDALAERLCNGICMRCVNGVERKEINLKTGEYFDESEFDLS